MSSMALATIILAGIAWLGLLFTVAVIGERSTERWRSSWPVVYSLSLAIYCTAWTFYGTTSQTARFGWPIPPTFVGTILMFALGTGFLIRLVELSKQAHSTSIADFIASRFGKSTWLAAVVTGVAVLGIVPYIALQLKAVAMSFSALIAGRMVDRDPAAWQDLALYVAVLMAVFAMLFGTRRMAVTEHNPGLVLAMSFESLFKLFAMLALGAFVLFGLFSGPADLAAAPGRPEPSNPGGFITFALLGALAMFTLPHQFHIGVVECRNSQHVRTARWLFPVFLLLISLPTVPLAWAGNALLQPRDVPADLYVLLLPLSEGRQSLALFAFLGGLSAAASMVILASLTLSIMIGNHWLTPALLNRGIGPIGELSISVRQQRRLGIVLVLVLAYAYSRVAGMAEALSDIGGLSFSGLAQLAPAVVLAVYRPGLPARAVVAGILAGVLIWAYVLFVPLLFAEPRLWLVDGPMGLVGLSPAGLLGLGQLDALSRAVYASLLVNLGVIGLVARYLPGEPQALRDARGLGREVLRDLGLRFLPLERVDQLMQSARSDEQLESAVEHELAAVLGSASSRLLLEAAHRRTPAPLDTVADLVGQATVRARFSTEVLSGALENMSQGVCVVDRDLRLVAWNSAYLALFDYPPELIEVGQPVARLLRHNAEHGQMGPGDLATKVRRRLAFMRQGSRQLVERTWPDGRIIEIRGNPMPGGGFVATFTDVTAFRKTARELRAINETLELRVGERTAELEQAKQQAEYASEAKTRFLAAVSHDLVQPLNAAQLLTHALAGRLADGAEKESLGQISGALAATENLLEGLLDISRLDAGGMEPRITRFPLGELFAQLHGEFRLMAEEKGLRLNSAPTSVWVASDPRMLRRILQNFLSNAVRYTERGRIVIGCRRQGEHILAGVWDTGPGIAEADRQVIFEEFRRLDKDRGAPGLGLGLAIAERMARLLDHALTLSSREGLGSFLGVRVPRAEALEQGSDGSPKQGRAPSGRVLVVDNDPTMLQSLVALLESWGLCVLAATDVRAAEQAWATVTPDLMVLDYHLNDARTGLDLLKELRAASRHCPTILISADHAAEVRHAARAAGCEFLHKPIRPLALRSLITRLVGQLS